MPKVSGSAVGACVVVVVASVSVPPEAAVVVVASVSVPPEAAVVVVSDDESLHAAAININASSVLNQISLFFIDLPPARFVFSQWNWEVALPLGQSLPDIEERVLGRSVENDR
jgi:hypothetical protein